MARRMNESEETVPRWHADFVEAVMGRFSALEAGQAVVVNILTNLDGRVKEQNGAVATLTKQAGEFSEFVLTHPRDSARDLNLELARRDVAHALEADTIRKDLLDERQSLALQHEREAGQSETDAKWWHRIARIPNLAYVVLVLTILLFFSHRKEWIEALPYIGRALVP
jgi:hypothetical protein